MPKVSIIVPIYNNARYLSKCIRSILKQSFKDFELILIDDGSTDSGGAICDIYVSRDSRIKFIHKKNEGVSIARNIGIEKASGDFIVFVDSDDWLPKNAIKDLYESISFENVDIVVGAVKKFALHTFSQKLISKLYKLSSNADLIDFFFISNCFWRGPVCKIFSTKIIKQNGIKFWPNITFGEDTIFVLEYLKNSDKIKVLNKVVYCQNVCNLKSASHKYHDNANESYKAIFNLQKELLEKTNAASLDPSTFAIQCLDSAIRYYCLIDTDLDNFTCKVENLFQFLNQYIRVESIRDNNDLKLYRDCVDGMYRNIYTIYKEKLSSPILIPNFVRNFLINVKLFLLFGSGK